MARTPKYPATVCGFSQTGDRVDYVKVAFYNPKSKHVNVEFLRPGFQAPIGVSWGDRGTMQYVNGLYFFAKV
jgi:hypothetical protein